MKNQLTLAALLSVFSGVAVASLPEFAALDQDRDGVISQEEASVSEELVAMFNDADADKDGALSRAEYDAIK